MILSEDKQWLEKQVEQVQKFLQDNLKLELHPDKVFIRKFRQGIDFLGYVILPYYTVLRTKTKKRMLKKIKQKNLELAMREISEESFNQSLQSYLGILSHCKGHKINNEIRKMLKTKNTPKSGVFFV